MKRENSVKDKVLSILRKAPVSGEDMAKELGITRAAVWKAVKSLEDDGYGVLAIKGKGYSLAENDLLDFAEIETLLREKGRTAEFLRAVDSTNSYLKGKAVSQEVKAGHVVIADEQTAGRGRLNREFISAKRQGLYISFLFEPPLPSSELSLVTVAAAVAAAKAVELTAKISVGIKWVNDLFFDGKKICGILTEGFFDLETGTSAKVIVGIGINTGKVPDEVKDIATSISEAAGKGNYRQNLARNLIEEMDNALNLLYRDKKELVAEYKKRLFMLNRRVTVRSFNESYPAIALDIDENCALAVRKDSGETLKLFSGEVSLSL